MPKAQSISVPKEHGNIIERYQGESPYLVYLLKTAVGDEKGQQRVADLIEHLYNTYKVKDVFIDTLTGELGLTGLSGLGGQLFHPITSFGTPEFIQLSGHLPLRFVGVESQDLHIKQQELFKSLNTKFAQFASIFQQIEQCLESLRRKYYPPTLQDFEDLFNAFNSPSDKNVRIDELIDAVDTNVKAGTIKWDNYPHMRLVANARDLPKPDQKLMNEQLKQLLAVMTKTFMTNEFAKQEMIMDLDLWFLGATYMLLANGHANTLEEAIEAQKALPADIRLQMYMKFQEKISVVLVSLIGAMSNPDRKLDAQAQKTIREVEVFSGLELTHVSNEILFQILVDLSNLARIDLESDYPEFLKGAHQMAHSHIMSVTNKLIAETNRLRSDIRRNLAKTEECKLVVQMHQHFEGMQMLASLNAMPDEAPYIDTDYDIPPGGLTLERFLQFGLLDKYMTRLTLKQLQNAQPEVDNHLRKTNQFYLLAEKRSESIVSNGLSKLEGSYRTDVILVVTGHLELYITKELKRNKVSYVSINPKVDDAAAASIAYKTSLKGSLDAFATPKDTRIINQMASAIQAQDWANAIEIGEEHCLESESNLFDLRPIAPLKSNLFDLGPIAPIVGPTASFHSSHLRFVRKTYSIPSLKLRKTYPILYFYLAVAHSNSEDFVRASAFALAAADTCDEHDSELKAQITLLQSQLKQIIETLRSNEDGRFVQFLEPILQEGNWHEALFHLEDYCFDQTVLGHHTTCSDESNVALPTIYHSIHPMILFYLAIAYTRNQYPKTALKVAEFALSNCEPEHKDVRSQLEGLVGQLKSAAHTEAVSEVARLLNEDENNWGTAMNKLDDILERDKSNAIAYFYRAICWQRMMARMLENLGGNIDSSARDVIRKMCAKLSDNIESARYYGSVQDTAMHGQLDALEQFRFSICG